MARTPRKWQGARTPSGLKGVRQAERRHAILQPRRSAAKTLVAKALTTATTQPDSDGVVSLDSFETYLWFRAAGDECLNCGSVLDEMSEDRDPLIIRVH